MSVLKNDNVLLKCMFLREVKTSVGITIDILSTWAVIQQTPCPNLYQEPSLIESSPFRLAVAQVSLFCAHLKLEPETIRPEHVNLPKT